MARPTWPLDCLILVGNHLDSLRDLNAFLRVNRDIHSTLKHQLYRRDLHISTTLQWAAAHGVEGTFQRAIDAGIALERFPEFLKVLASCDRADLLHSLFAHQPALRAVIDHGAVNIGSPLVVAIRCHNVSAANILIENGADIDYPYGKMPLGEAVARFHAEPILLYRLLQSGADTNLIGERGYSPFIFALRKSVPDNVLELLIKFGADVDPIANSSIDLSPLHVACHRGSASAVRLLLAHGARPNHASEFGLAPLHFAAERISTEIASDLLRNGADPNAITLDGVRPLCIALKRKCRAMVSLLIKHGADATSHQGFQSPLSLAIESQNLYIIKAVLGAGADIAELENHDVRAALQNENLEIPQYIWSQLLKRKFPCIRQRADCFLVAAGGDYDVMLRDYENIGGLQLVFNPQNYSILHLASFYGRVDFVSELLAEVNPLEFEGLNPLHTAAWSGCIPAAQVLIKHGFSVHSETTSGMTPMIGAAIEGCVDVMKLLIDAGAAVDCMDNLRNIPLHYAIEANHLDGLVLLLKHGASLRHKNIFGHTPVHCAWTRPDVIELLKETPHVDLGAPDGNGFNILTKAAEAGYSDVVEALFVSGSTFRSDDGAWLPFEVAPRLIGNVPDRNGTLPVFAALRSRDWDTVWRFLVIQDDVFMQKDAENKTVITRVWESGNEYLLYQLLMYAAKNKLRVLWEHVARAEHLANQLCNFCKMYIAGQLPLEHWDSKCHRLQSISLNCRITNGIHTWDAVGINAT